MAHAGADHRATDGRGIAAAATADLVADGRADHGAQQRAAARVRAP